MRYVYVDLELTTGLSDGSSWANAYKTWAAFVSANAGTLTDDLTVYLRSAGTTDQTCSLASGWTFNGYTLTVEGVSNCVLYRSGDYAIAIGSNTTGSYGTGTLVYKNIIIKTSAASTGLTAVYTRASGISHRYENIAIINPTASGYGFYLRSGGLVDFYNCIAIGGQYGWRTIVGGTYTAYNCYGANNATYQPTYILKVTSASADTSGSAGLTGIPYDTTTFVNVTPGSEDFHTVSGSPLRDAGTTTAYTTDFVGNTRTSPFDIGIYEYVSSITLIDGAGNIPSGESFGSHAISVSISAESISSEESFSYPTISLDILPGSIESDESFGLPTIYVNVNIVEGAGNIESGESFNSPSLSISISTGSIQSAESFGTPDISILIEAQGIESSEVFGLPIISIWDGIVGAGNIASSEFFGLPTIYISGNIDRVIYSRVNINKTVEAKTVPGRNVIIQSMYREINT